MRKLIYTLGILATAAFTFSSCQKEKSIEPSRKLVTVTFTAEKAGLDTKTAAVEGDNEVSYKWTDEDVTNIKLFTVSTTVNDKGEEVEVLTVVENPRVSKISDTNLTIAADVAPNSTYQFRAVLAGTWTNDGKKPRIGENQSPSATNFDPAADVLVSDDMEVTVGAANDGEETVATDALEMVFRRQVVVNKMTLKNLTAGDAIKKVVITSNKEIAGFFNARTPSGDKKTITLNYNDVPVPEGNVFPVYFTTIPGKGHSLTVEVTTNQYVYTKSFAEGKSVDFNLGQFTKFNLALPAGVANTALTLPVEDAMTWAMTGGSDETTAMSTADLTPIQGGKKIYDSSSNAYKGGDGLKLGKSGEVGSITTNAIDLSSKFYVAIDAKRFSTDKVKLSIAVDGTVVYTTPENLTADYETYYFNSSAATKTSIITISTVANSDKRGYIKNLVIGSGTYVEPPVINVTSAIPIEVPNTASNQTIEYTIANPTTGSALSATTEDEWITSIDYSISGKVTFSVAAQEAGSPARDGSIVLTYPGAKQKEVTVSQAAGQGGASDYTYVFTENSWKATLNGEAANWISNGTSGYALDGTKGVQVTKAKTGAGASSPVSFAGISKVTITLSRTSSGAGSVALKVGNTSIGTQSEFTTSPTAYTFNVNNLTGEVSFVVTCTTNSIYVKDITITATGTVAPKYAITLTQPSGAAFDAGCRISATVNGSAISSGDKFEEGTEVTLSATAGTNYSFEKWNISGASYTTSNGITVLTVGKSDVSVSASFKSNDSSWITEVFPSSGTSTSYAGDKTVEAEHLTWYLHGSCARNSTDSAFDVSEALTMGKIADNTGTTNAYSGSYANFESSVISEGISKLKFDYIGNSRAFKVEVVVGDNVVWSQEGFTATTTMQSSGELNVTNAASNAVIRFVNTSGDRRVTVGNISWQ